MDWRIWAGVTVALIIACMVLYWMHTIDARENEALKTALASQGALLRETQAELQLRDTVISQRDAEVAELERAAEKKDRQYAKLLRDKKEVRDWDAVILPDDVSELLKAAGSDSADRSAGSPDARGGNP